MQVLRASRSDARATTGAFERRRPLSAGIFEKLDVFKKPKQLGLKLFECKQIENNYIRIQCSYWPHS